MINSNSLRSFIKKILPYQEYKSRHGQKSVDRIVRILCLQASLVLPFLLSFIFLCFYAKTRLLEHNVYPVGDLAADMLLANQIYTKGYLLTGQYSRFGFHHPGPFFFYLTYFFERIFSCYLLSRAAIWTLAMIFLNSLLLTLSSWLAFERTPKLFMVTLKRVLFTFVTLYYVKDFAISSWPPDKIVVPFMAFILTLPYLAKRDLRYVPLSIFLLSILFQGRVDSPIFTFFPLLCVLMLAFLNNRGPIQPIEWRSIMIGVSIGLVFLFPILVDFVMNRHSNLALIFGSMQQLRVSAASWNDLWKYLWGYWKEETGIMIYVFVVISILKGKQISDDWTNRALLTVSTLETGIFLIYFKTTPPPLYHYMGEFYLVIPILLFSRPVINALGDMSFCFLKKTALKRTIDTVLINALIVAVPFMLAGQMSRMAAPPEEQNKDIPRLTAEIVKLTQSNRVIRMRHPHSLWPVESGLLLEFAKEHIRACSTFEELSFLFTPEFTCGPREKPNVELVASKNCLGKCTSVIGDIGLVEVKVEKETRK